MNRPNIWAEGREIIFEDNHLLVINKPAGLLVQGDATGDEPLSKKAAEYLRFKYKNLFWVGAGYRSRHSVMADVGVMIKDHFQISYAYDQRASDAFKYTSGSHELVLGYHFAAHKRYKSYH